MPVSTLHCEYIISSYKHVLMTIFQKRNNECSCIPMAYGVDVLLSLSFGGCLCGPKMLDLGAVIGTHLLAFPVKPVHCHLIA